MGSISGKFLTHWRCSLGTSEMCLCLWYGPVWLAFMYPVTFAQCLPPKQERGCLRKTSLDLRHLGSMWALDCRRSAETLHFHRVCGGPSHRFRNKASIPIGDVLMVIFRRPKEQVSPTRASDFFWAQKANSIPST